MRKAKFLLLDELLRSCWHAIDVFGRMMEEENKDGFDHCQNLKSEIDRHLENLKKDNPAWYRLPRPEEPEGMKFCVKCKELKSIDRFYKHPLTYDGKQSHCIDCFAQAVIDRKALKEKVFSQDESILNLGKGK